MTFLNTALTYAWTYKLPIYIAVREFAGQLWSAFAAALPNPDDSKDWPFSKYRLFYKTVRLWHNKNPNPPPAIPLPK